MDFCKPIRQLQLGLLGNGGWTGYTHRKCCFGFFHNGFIEDVIKELAKLAWLNLPLTLQQTERQPLQLMSHCLSLLQAVHRHWVGACADFFVTGVNGFTRIGGGALS
jgi:hypothetical protein